VSGHAIEATELGWLARDALIETRGRARVVAILARSAYLEAGATLFWLGAAGSPLHGRAVVVTDRRVPTALADEVALDVMNAAVWTPADDPPAIDAPTVAVAARSLLTRLAEAGTPEGFATLLTGRACGFPFDRAAPAARALALASHDGDTGAATRAAGELIGLGPGLTPAGDDFVGGVFFARARLGPPPSRERWRAAGEIVCEHARQATHPISAILLADLVAGRGHAPLHDLARGVALGASPAALIEPTRRLVRIGHSSGWDMLAGFLAALIPPTYWHSGCSPS
jgi:hypothetical protein